MYLDKFSLPLKGKCCNLFPTPLDSIPLILEEINLSNCFVIFTENVEQSLKLFNSWRFFYPERKIIYFPDWEILPYEKFSPSKDQIAQRIISLWEIINNKHFILIIPITTSLQKLPPKSYISQNTFFIHEKDKIDIEILRKNLLDCGYLSVNNVIAKGEFAIRGEIIDLFPINNDKPFRIDLFDNEIESIKIFDCNTQLTQSKLKSINILPSYEFPTDKSAQKTFCRKYREVINLDINSIPYKNVSNNIFGSGIEYYFPLFFEEEVATIFNYLPQNVFILSIGNILEQARKYYNDIELKFKFSVSDIDYPPLPPKYLFINSNQFSNFLKNYSVISINNDSLINNDFILPDVSVNYKLKQSIEKFIKFSQNFSGRILICAESLSRIEIIIQLMDKFNLKLIKVSNWNNFLAIDDKICITLMEDLINGFIVPCKDISIVTELDLYKSTFRSFIPNKKLKYKTSSTEVLIRDLSEINIGDKVVHEEYGIGVYRGLIDINSQDGISQFMLLEYQDNAKLYVPVSKIFLVTKYLGQDNVILNKLGKSDWSKLKQKVLYKSYDVAAQLLELYAKRQLQTRDKYIFDKDLYNQFIKGFNYQETQDQMNAINDVINDLTNKNNPMDRLICGDVGFGKTEVALRASFLVAINGRQVAILVPTTLLVEQHLKIFLDRFINFPIKVGSLSRFSSNKENLQILKQLEQGTIDIVIGTHKLIQSSIKFKNLGLLIIDEEHRFGVKQKEYLKKLKTNIDFLNLTATPIPRTLSMALDGIRDLSIIATAPEKRLPIKTFIYDFSDVIIKEAVLREMKRNGQVFFLHNEVNSMEIMYKKLTKLLPQIAICMAHGQLPEKDLANIMRDFLHNRYNLMICSTIIETGIDIPNVNTIIINRADKFGIAQLHQLRGRVGRSNHQAYAYLLVPEYLSKDARKRLNAIVFANELGTGFTLAIHDLEIRGSGEILGQEQSGQLNQVGLTLYSNMLKKAINNLKNNKTIEDIEDNEITQIKLYIPALIPSTYCPDTCERLVLYKRLSLCKSYDEIDNIYLELIDRFGFPLDPVRVLLETNRLRIFVQEKGIIEIDAPDEKIIFTFSKNNKINNNKVIDLIQKESYKYKLLDNNKLLVKVHTNGYEDKIQKIYTIVKDIIN